MRFTSPQRKTLPVAVNPAALVQSQRSGGGANAQEGRKVQNKQAQASAAKPKKQNRGTQDRQGQSEGQRDRSTAKLFAKKMRPGPVIVEKAGIAIPPNDKAARSSRSTRRT